MKVLIVQEPHLTELLNGIKTWEIRRQNTNIRGLIGLGRNRKMYGKAVLKDCFPMALEKLAEHEHNHHVSYQWLKAYAKEKRILYVWVLTDAQKFKKPI